jgi:hypothetical protein
MSTEEKQFENGNINVVTTFKYGMTAKLHIHSSAQTDYMLLGKSLINEGVSVSYEQTFSDYLSTKMKTLRSSETSVTTRRNSVTSQKNFHPYHLKNLKSTRAKYANVYNKGSNHIFLRLRLLGNVLS